MQTVSILNTRSRWKSNSKWYYSYVFRSTNVNHVWCTNKSKKSHPSSAHLRESWKQIPFIMVMICFQRFYHLDYLILVVRLRETLKKPIKDQQTIPITSSTFQIVNILSWPTELRRLWVLFYLLAVDGAALSVILTSVLTVLITLWVSAILFLNGTLGDICVGHSYKICQQNIQKYLCSKYYGWLDELSENGYSSDYKEIVQTVVSNDYLCNKVILQQSYLKSGLPSNFTHTFSLLHTMEFIIFWHIWYEINVMNKAKWLGIDYDVPGFYPYSSNPIIIWLIV